MRGYIKRMSILLIIILIIFLGFKFDLISFGSWISFSNQEEKSSAIITEKIEILCNLSTVKYNYQEILDYSDIVKLGKMKLPFGLGEKKALITYRAYINGGCQFTKLEEVSEEQVKVYLGKGRILDNVLQLDSVNIYDIQEGIFNKFNIDDDTVLINADMKKYEEENREEITRKAEENAGKMVKSFLQTLGYKDIEIIFQ
jgi:acetyltransferase-like isoleucine patch superfamily enzyme